MKELAVQLSTNETIIHTGGDIYTLRDDFGFIVVGDFHHEPTGGQDKHLATYNPAFIVSMRHGGA